MNLARSLGLVMITLTCACASAPPQTATTAQAGRRHRPRHSAVNRVLATAAERAAGCIPPTVQTVTVTGAFDGPSGEYRVEGVESAQPIGSSVRSCIRQEFESARVDPFIDPTYPASRSFGPESEADAGAATASAAPSGADAGSVAVATTATDAATPRASAPPATETASAAPPSTTTSTGNTSTASAAPNTPTTTRPLGQVRQVGPARAIASEAGPVPRATVLGCYRAVTRQDATLGGRIRLRFTVTTDGAPQNVRAENLGTPTGHAPLFAEAMRCVEGRVRHMTFDQTGSGEFDLLVTLNPSRAGGDVSIERAALGLLAAAPGTGPLASPAPTEPPPTGTIAVSGTSAPEASHAVANADEMRLVSGVMRGRVNDIRACYQQGLGRDASLQLRLRVRFALQASGSTSNVSSTATVGAGDADAATAVAECIENLVRGTSFTARAGGNTVEVVVPFTFAPTATSSTAGASNTGASTATPTGRIDPVRTSEVIRNQTGTIRECYARALASDPALAGRVMVRFTVDPAGRVLSPSAQTTTRGGNPAHLDEVAHCIEDVLEAMTLPPPTGGPAAVALPFDFGPSS